MEYSGGSGDIFDPYGGDADVYTLFFESLRTWVTQLEQKLFDEMSQKNTKEEK